MDASVLLIRHYQDLPGIAHLQNLGTRILMLAFLVGLARETYRLITRGACDYATPVVKVGIGFLVVGHIGWIGDTLAAAALNVSRAMFEASEPRLFSEAFAHVVGPAFAAGDGLPGFFSLKTFVLAFACGLYLLMMLIKLLVIDIGWPLCFSLVLLLGLVAAPVGLLPGNSLGGWAKSLVEVALWPIIFQLLVAMMVGSFSESLAAIRRMDPDLLFQTPVMLGNDRGSAAAGQLKQQFTLMLEFWALCFAYAAIALFTPKIAHMAMGSASVTALTGEIGAKLQQVALLAGGFVGGSALGAKLAAGAGLGDAASTGSSSGSRSESSGAGGAAGTNGEQVTANRSESRGGGGRGNGLDRREYPGAEPRKETENS